ncbi:hypothetical protein [Sulfurimonas marina]|uniref:Uncharacterized protein n=1 Tax=Sulfurimonas marina TaxID=2590551 RepID=A0A7M1AVI3_9BACT|nr:hypothetical protein [Sulfurimonas marina]QOP41396.1 hypothetical protein FJR03_06415 [Sulfurimonas marina]
MVYIGYLIVYVQKFYMHGYYVDFSDPYLHWPIGFITVVFGVYTILTAITYKYKACIDDIKD